MDGHGAGPAGLASGWVRDLPAGTLTFLLTDIEGSTRSWDEQPGAMRQALVRHNDLLGSEIENHGGRVLRDRGEGDSFFAIFDGAGDAVEAACAIQQALVRESWPTSRPLRVRMALHSGNAEPAYWDPVINRCARLRALSQGGQVLLSAATADLVRGALPDGAGLLDLGEHRLRDLARPERIHQLLHPALPREFLPLVSVDSYPNNLPVQLTSLVGRAAEIAEIIDHVSHHRLTTLVGPGGIGKTRLALQAASESIDRHQDGVWLVDLSLIGDAELVMAQVAAGAGIQEERGIGLEARIGEALAARTTLLVLDNCEHVVGEVARLLEHLLRTCPRLTVLATSREPLRVTGEWVWNVPALSADDAALLFNERAGVRRADAHPPDRSGAVNRICMRLDGIPLAIELAAARARTLSLTDIESRLDDRFKLLAGGPRTAAARQRTLRGAVEWSHDLLDEAERAAFRRLSVMPGPFDLAAAEAVITDGAPQSGEVLDLVISLAERSLLIAEPQAEASRYRFLETLRHFGREQLTASGEEQAVLQRLSTHYALVAEKEESHLRGADTENALDRLESAYPNLRLALEWGLEHDPVLNLRIATALVLYWKTRGHLNEGRGWLGPEVGEIAAPAELRIRGLNAAGQLAQHQSDFVLARQSYLAALEIATAAGDSMARARALNNLGTVAEEQGDYERATAAYDDAAGLLREQGELHALSVVLNNVGALLTAQGRPKEARHHLEESLRLRRQIEDSYGIALGLGNLAELEFELGDHDAAQTLLDESLEIRQKLQDKSGMSSALQLIAAIRRTRGDLEGAREAVSQSLEMEQELGDRRGIAAALEAYALVHLAAGLPTTSLRLLAAASHLREQIASPAAPYIRRRLADAEIEARASLGSADEAAWQEGRRLSPVAAAAEAMHPPRSG